MKAGEVSLQGTLNSPNQYFIPVFQRHYSWKKDNWEQLWTDLMDMLGPDQPKHKHFMGALVFVPDKHFSHKPPAYLVIDGQQRIITLSLLLCAVRNSAIERGYDSLGAEITQTYLTHPFNTGRERFRVYPRFRDRNDYLTAIEGISQPGGIIGQALHFFELNLSEAPNGETEEGLRELFVRIISGLEFVHISLEGENPYRIFRSLNSTGLDLSEADLIRNFVFMHVPVEEQDQFDDKLWKPLEGRFTGSNGELDVKSLSAFFRDFLMREGQYVPPAATFEYFENRYESASFDSFNLVKELEPRAALYDEIRGTESHSDPSISFALFKLRQLESSTAHPLVLNLMERMQNGSISAAELADGLEVIAGFIFRRFICGESSRAYSRWFVAACKELTNAPITNLNVFLAKKGFPTDDRFRDQLLKFNLYDSRYCRTALGLLERLQPYGTKGEPHKEQADLSTAEIEHIMPQTLSQEWKNDLGPRADEIYGQWVNTVGNLTLSAYNRKLYNHPFREKRREYAGSKISITQSLACLTEWSDTEIQNRGIKLAELATQIWRGPDFKRLAQAGVSPEMLTNSKE